MDTIKLPNSNDIKNHKSFLFKMNNVEEREGYAYIKGYGAVKGNTDFGDDIITDGAFSKTEQERKGKVPFLRDHIANIDNTLGVVNFKEDGYGLFCEFEINLSTQVGKEAYALAKQMQDNDMPMGLSIGFGIPKGKSEFVDMDGKEVRLIKEVILYEVSMTLYPMNDKARMTDVKSLLDFYGNYSYIPTSLVKKVINSSTVEPVNTSIDEADAKATAQIAELIGELKQLTQRLNNGK